MVLAGVQNSNLSKLPPGTTTKKQSLEYAFRTGVCADEMMSYSAWRPHRESWCAARLRKREYRLFSLGADVKTVLVSHCPLVQPPTDAQPFPESAQWCGTSWTSRLACAVSRRGRVYGHLHIARIHVTMTVFALRRCPSGSLSEWGLRIKPPALPRKVLPP